MRGPLDQARGTGGILAVREARSAHGDSVARVDRRCLPSPHRRLPGAVVTPAWQPRVAPSVGAPEAQLHEMDWDEGQRWCNFVLMRPVAFSVESMRMRPEAPPGRKEQPAGGQGRPTWTEANRSCHRSEIAMGSRRLRVKPYPPKLDQQPCSSETIELGGTTVHHAFLDRSFGPHECVWQSHGDTVMLLVKPVPSMEREGFFRAARAHALMTALRRGVRPAA